ncbi:MAG: CBS domain-containing protein [Deltaproteobacteria bacterium]|nr:CBS domain-containing protein [Deltaproteobacteria bacterium]
MVVRDCMTTTVETVKPDDDVATVREVLRRRRIRQIPVVAAGRVIGIITDRDVRAVTDARTTVDAVMTPTPATVAPDTPVEVAAATLRQRKIGALPVVLDHALVGIVSESDLLGALVDLCARLEQTTVLALECDEDASAVSRIREIFGRHGATVAWISSVRTRGGKQAINVRVRMPPERGATELLADAGFRVVSCVASPKG